MMKYYFIYKYINSPPLLLLYLAGMVNGSRAVTVPVNYNTRVAIDKIPHSPCV